GFPPTVRRPRRDCDCGRHTTQLFEQICQSTAREFAVEQNGLRWGTRRRQQDKEGQMIWSYLLAALILPILMVGFSDTAVAEILYVGDANDTIRRYDAHAGVYLDDPAQGSVAKGVFVTPGLGGLSGPRGMTLLGNSPLLVINQNVARPFSSAILRFN